MSFVFYPELEQSCPNVGRCPHVGGAAIGTVVSRANDNELYLRQLHGTISDLRERMSGFFEEIQRLQKELDQAKLELKLERQNKFATNTQKNNKKQDASATRGSQPGKKPGAPVGHPGWFRKTPAEYDWDVDVEPPTCCPFCRGSVTVRDDFDPAEHLQEDVIDGQYRVVLYRHPAACCDDCGEWVQQAGEGELVGSRLGPSLRSKVLFLRDVIGMSYRKIPQALQEFFGIVFTPATVIGFEKLLAKLAEPVVKDIAKKLASSDGAVHADETYSILNGKRAYF